MSDEQLVWVSLAGALLAIVLFQVALARRRGDRDDR